MCFCCSTLFVKLIQGDTLGEAAGTCVHPLGHVWCQPVAWAALCQLRSLPGTTYQLKHKPFLFLFAPSRADTHGRPTWKFKRINASITGEQERVASSVLSFSRARQRRSASFSRGASRMSSCCPHQQPFFFFFNWWFFYYYFLILTRGHFLYCF